MCYDQNKKIKGQHCANSDQREHRGEYCSVLSKSVFIDLKQQIIKITYIIVLHR